MRVKMLSVLAAAAIVAISAALMGSLRAPPAPQPAMEVQLLDGRRVAFSQGADGPLLVTFWASNCPQCIAELPELRRLHRELGPQGLGMMSVSVYWDDLERTAALTRREALSWTLATDPKGDLARAFGRVVATPTSFLLDPRGRVVRKVVGQLTAGSLDAAIGPLLAESRLARQ